MVDTNQAGMQNFLAKNTPKSFEARWLKEETVQEIV
jgi:hypothetical protein